MSKFITYESKTANEPGIRYIGRFDFTDIEGPKFAWSASTVTARFFGTRVSAKLKSFGDNYFLVLIDRKIVINSLKLGEGEEKVFELASNLKEEEHEVSIVKRTEFYLGTAQFLGFNFGEGKLLSPSPRLERKIEIIGDSITCGFGNEAENENIEYSPKYDNSYLAYGTIAARKLNAEPMIIGRSGFGLIRDYEGNKDNILPNVYSRVLPDKNSEWEFHKFIPQVVVINLGTNDFSGSIPSGPIADREEFTSAYINLINRIRENYKESKVICTIGPVMDGEALEVIRDYVKNDVVEALRKENNNWIYYFEYENQLKSNGYGITCHPSLKTHELMANQLTDFINDILGW
ncbi:GDSL-like protein [Clostridiales bacterium oral taxon 876 str. F0540]|nr:GDSL-like protein [Clostridiales bacterium oral taxon 876 str. F0540]